MLETLLLKQDANLSDKGTL